MRYLGLNLGRFILLILERGYERFSMLCLIFAGARNITARDGNSKTRHGARRLVLGVVHPSVGGMSFTGSYH
jgi:hypothetical protein